MKPAYFPAHYRLADKLGWLALRAFSAAVLLFLLLPVLVIVPLSFSSGSFLAYPLPGWSLQWYRELFASAEWARAARNSFIVAPWPRCWPPPWARWRPWGWRARASWAKVCSAPC